MDSIGFERRRTLLPPVEGELLDKMIFDYPVDKPYGYWKSEEKVIPGRKYFNMKLEDFDEYKAHGEKPVLQGPSPYHAMFCGCDRYRVSSMGCVCSMECREKPLYHWAKAHPEEFQQKQKEMHRWRHLWTLWLKQKDELSYQWDNKTHSTRMHFQWLQDDESPIGCAHCERNGRDYCNCECEECGSKYCPGCYRDDDYDY